MIVDEYASVTKPNITDSTFEHALKGTLQESGQAAAARVGLQATLAMISAMSVEREQLTKMGACVCAVFCTVSIVHSCADEVNVSRRTPTKDDAGDDDDDHDDELDDDAAVDGATLGGAYRAHLAIHAKLAESAARSRCFVALGTDECVSNV